MIHQLHLRALQMQIPQIPPIIVAAKAIADNLKANVLFEYSKEVIEGLIKRGIKITSYLCDSTENERNMQWQFLQHYQGTAATYLIPHLRPTEGMVDMRFIYILGQAVTMVQDSKHALKTYCGNATSGAHLLVLGNYTVLF